MGLYAKLTSLQKVTRSLAPDSKGGAANYNYISGAKLLSVIRPEMDKLGLLLVQEVTNVSNVLVDYNTRSGEKKEMHSTVHMLFTWVDAETGEKLPCQFTAMGQNGFDKSLGSALTYGERYFLLKFFHIATDEDDCDALVKEEPIATKKTPTAKDLANIAKAIASTTDEELKHKYVNAAEAKFAMTAEAWNEIFKSINE